jgi:pantothenate kinase type III
MIQGLCIRLKDIIGKESRVVATGGLAESIAAVCPEIDNVCEDLLLKGLLMIYFENINKDFGEDLT